MSTSGPWTTLAVLDWTTRRFTEAGLDSPRLDAQLLLAHVLGCDRVQLYTGFDKPLAEAELGRYRELIRRRLAGEPVAYLLGEQEFWGQPLWVDRHVLVPRRDTETLIEVVLAGVPARDQPLHVLDLCTGSGAIAIALARELPAATILATDLSPEAAEVARRNAVRAGVADRVTVATGDLFAAAPGERQGGFELIVANPPYVATAVLAGLAPEVQHEPALALDGGADGLVVLRRLVAEAPRWLTAGGRCVLEHGYDQGDAVAALFTAAPAGTWRDVATQADLGGQPRVTSARRA
ncbi:MAG: peptide chain release factor N(5)-glutamine methyltransferase [Kofleriaceae bacterium]|nr:peptide chain release factor N(5)-glutamine methyltransferase [Kofleriaceae bacterium]